MDLDRQIIDQLNGVTPPEEEIRRINPWSKPIGFVTWGLILTTLQLNFLYLQYLMPTIGVILIFLGFRSLRDENRYFKMVWILAIVKLSLQLANLVRVSTPLNLVNYPRTTVGAVMLALQISMFLIFHTALKEAYKRSGRLMESAPLLRASVWAVAAFFVALSPLSSSPLAFIPLAICYIRIVQSLYRVGSQLGDTGYILLNAPVRTNNRAFGLAYFLVALAIVITCSAFYNHLKVEPREYHPPETTAARQDLLGMGFPAEALQLLGDEDVTMLSGAINVEAFSELMKDIESTTVYIEMPENVVFVMESFAWKEGQPVWQDGILISGETKTKDKQIIGSGLFYSTKGTKYTANFPRLVCGKMAQDTFFGPERAVSIAGALSYPFGSKDQSGYVLYRYTVMADSDKYVTQSLFNYMHLSNPLRIPYAKTEDLILSGTFVSADELQQHYTSYGSLALTGRSR